MPTAGRYQLFDVPGVEIFAAGDYSDGRVTSADLRQIVNNYYKLRTLHTPPVGIGHDEDQAKLPILIGSDARPWFAGPTGSHRSDAPAAGWCRNLRYVPDPLGGTIVGDFAEVPEPIARLIEARSYRKVSAEIYTFNDGMGTKYPNTLRRVSLEGFTPPVVKRLKDLPLPIPSKQYAERTPARVRLAPCKRSASGSGVVYYSEVFPMNKAQLLTSIMGTGLKLSTAVTNAMTDDEVKELYGRVCVTKRAEGDPPPAPTTPPDANEPTREMMIEELAKMGEDASQLSQLSDDDLKALYMKRKADSNAATQTPPVAGGQPSDVAKQYAEVTRLHAEIKRYAEAAKRDRKLALIDSHLNRLSQLGKVTPAERDGLSLELLDADDATVRKFSENGKQYAETPFNAKLRRLNDRRPVVKFGEQMANPAIDHNASAMEYEKEQVRMYAEQNEPALKGFGKSVTEFVNGFETLAKAGRVRTAAEYLGTK